MKRKICAVLAALLLCSSTPTVFHRAGTFSDVPANHWASASIERMASHSIVEGVGNGKFHPEASISGAEFASMLARAFWPEALAKYLAEGADWQTAAAKTIQEKSGFAHTSFVHDDTHKYDLGDLSCPMNRYDMAAMLYNILLAKEFDMPPETEQEKMQKSLADWNTIPSLYQSPVSICVISGLLTGKADGQFMGDDSMTRAESAVVLSRLLDVLEKQTEPTVEPTQAQAVEEQKKNNQKDERKQQEKEIPLLFPEEEVEEALQSESDHFLTQRELKAIFQTEQEKPQTTNSSILRETLATTEDLLQEFIKGNEKRYIWTDGEDFYYPAKDSMWMTEKEWTALLEQREEPVSLGTVRVIQERTEACNQFLETYQYPKGYEQYQSVIENFYGEYADLVSSNSTAAKYWISKTATLSPHSTSNRESDDFTTEELFQDAGIDEKIQRSRMYKDYICENSCANDWGIYGMPQEMCSTVTEIRLNTISVSLKHMRNRLSDDVTTAYAFWEATILNYLAQLEDSDPKVYKKLMADEDLQTLLRDLFLYTDEQLSLLPQNAEEGVIRAVSEKELLYQKWAKQASDQKEFILEEN